MIPISENVIQPKLQSNILFVNSFEEFEKLEIEKNSTIQAFNNNMQCFYVKSRDALGDYSAIKVFFYENINERTQYLSKEEFVEKCRKAKFDTTKTEIALKLLFYNEKPRDVWDWIIYNKIKDIEWDSVYTMKNRIKEAITPELIKRRPKKL